MGGRWKWFLRPRTVVLDLTGQAVPDGDVPGRFRRLAIEDVVPNGRATSRCDGAVVYEVPELRRVAERETERRALPAAATRRAAPRGADACRVRGDAGGGHRSAANAGEVEGRGSDG